jgi:hypothetical protein
MSWSSTFIHNVHLQSIIHPSSLLLTHFALQASSFLPPFGRSFTKNFSPLLHFYPITSFSHKLSIYYYKQRLQKKMSSSESSLRLIKKLISANRLASLSSPPQHFRAKIREEGGIIQKRRKGTWTFSRLFRHTTGFQKGRRWLI